MRKCKKAACWNALFCQAGLSVDEEVREQLACTMHAVDAKRLAIGIIMWSFVGCMVCNDSSRPDTRRTKTSCFWRQPHS